MFDVEKTHADAHWPDERFGNALTIWFSGPGGLYNVGNVIALATGVGVQVAAASGGGRDASDAIVEGLRAYLLGSPGATALTLAILIFIVAGEMYRRAWSNGLPPNRILNRRGDLLSAGAAIVLTIALATFGDIILALASGLLLAAGKLGSALVPENVAAAEPGPWPRRFRLLVIASRVPALASLAIQSAVLFTSHDTAPGGSLVLTPVTLVCFVLWTRADMLLMRSSAGS